jgi:hypothetical protein
VQSFGFAAARNSMPQHLSMAENTPSYPCEMMSLPP